MDFEYWKKQTNQKRLFPEIEWNKPERKNIAGKLALVGGNKLQFRSISDAYNIIAQLKVGEFKILTADSLKKILPKNDNIVFSNSNAAGGLSKDSLFDLLTIGNWSDGVLLIGDFGKNSETSIVIEKFISQFNKILVITRDSIDILNNNLKLIIERKNTHLVISLNQLQTILKLIYYPVFISFNMQLNRLVEIIHKFTITYPIGITTFHNGMLITSLDGNVVTQEFNYPLKLWSGELASRIASYWIWSPEKQFESAVNSLYST